MKCFIKFFMGIWLFSLGCKTNQKIVNQKGLNTVYLYNEGPWQMNFKNMVAIKILQKGYGNGFDSCCLVKDASVGGNIDWLNYDKGVLLIIDSVCNKYLKDHPFPYHQEMGKFVFNTAMDFRLSHELDSITQYHYKQYQQDSIQAEKLYHQ